MNGLSYFYHRIYIGHFSELYICHSTDFRTHSFREPFRYSSRIFEALIGCHNSTIGKHTNISSKMISLTITIRERSLIPGKNIILLKLLIFLEIRSHLNSHIETAIRVLTSLFFQRDILSFTTLILDNHMIIRNKLSNSTILFCSIDIIITYHISKCFIRPVSNKKRHTALRRHRMLRSLNISHSGSKWIVSSASKRGSSLSNRESLCNRFCIRICLLNITSLTLDIHIDSSLSINTYISRETSGQS